MSQILKLKELVTVTSANIEEAKNKLKDLGLSDDIITSLRFNKHTMLKFVVMFSSLDPTLFLLIDSAGVPVATSKEFEATHLWFEEDEAAFKVAGENIKESNKDYALAGFYDGDKIHSLFSHSAFLKMNVDEQSVSTIFDEVHEATLKKIRDDALSREKEVVGTAHELIQEAARKEPEAFKAVVEKDDVGEDFVRTKSVRRKRDEVLDTFMNRSAAYTMFDFVSVIKNHCNKDQWKLVKSICNFDPDTAKLLGELQNKFHFCEVAFEDNAKFSESVKEVEAKGAKEGALSIKEFASADQIGARLPQAYDKRGLFFATNHTVREGELRPYVNLYDEKRKMYYTSSSTQTVPYAIALSRATERFMDYATERDPNTKILVPRTQSLMKQYTDADFEVMADVLVTTRKKDKGSISVIFNTQGGRSIGDMGKEKVCKIGPLARLIGEGIPAPFKLQAAYQYDRPFADHWDSAIKTAVLARQINAGTEYQDWMDAAEVFHSTIQVNKRGVRCIPPLVEDKTLLEFDDLVSETHETNRAMVEAVSVDRSVFLMLFHRINPFANEMLCITMVNDLFFDQHDLDLFDSGDLVNVGYCSQVKRARMPVYEKDKVTMLEEWLDKFDIESNGKKAIIDMRLVHELVFFVGAGTWEEKIEKKKDKRASVYYDYEPVRSVLKNGRYNHTIVGNEESVQYKHAKSVCDKAVTSAYELTGVIVPIRSLPYFIKNYKVQFIYPAPFPAVMSVYIIVGKGTSKITLMNAYALVFMLYSKMRYMLSIVQSGAKELAKLLDHQIELESNDLYSDLFAAWHEKLVKRFRIDGEKKTKILIDDSLDKMLIVDSKYKVRSQIKAGKERADYNYGQFRLKRI